MITEQASDIPTTRSIVEGSLAQLLFGSAATVIVLTFASFGHFFPAGFESAFGTLLSTLGYIFIKSLRAK